MTAPAEKDFGGPLILEGWTAARAGARRMSEPVLSAYEEGLYRVRMAAASVGASVAGVVSQATDAASHATSAVSSTAVSAARSAIFVAASTAPARLLGLSIGPLQPPEADTPSSPDAANTLSVGVGPRASAELTGVIRTAPPAPARVKTAEEARVEGLVQSAFSEYFKELTVAGRRMKIRMPFALNDEREGGRGYTQVFYHEGKGTPEELWPYIASVLESKAFARYAAQLAGPGEKAVVFGLSRRGYSVSRNRQLVDALGMDSYPGTPTRIFVRKSEPELSEADVYNYLYAIATVGVDCSGFSYHVQETIARAYGVDLNNQLSRKLRALPRDVRSRVGLWFFDPANGYTEAVPDRLEELRPADMILFRGSDGKLKHSAVIQSIDFANGIIRYVQSTDWALESERGVHESLIRFDPARPRVSLRHYSVRWLQQVRPPFEGEEEPRDWLTDGDRYLWYTEAGGSLVVRPRYLSHLILEAEPRYYTILTPERRARITGATE